MGKTAKDVAVLLATGVTTVLTCIVLAFVDLTTGFSLYGFSLWFILPVGALLSGFVAASGCYLAGRGLNHKPTGIVLAGVLALSAAAFFLIHYLDYYFTTVDGLHVREFVSFTRYLGIELSNMSLCVHGCAGGGIELGPVGYVAAGLQVLGFFVGGASVYGYLSSLHYCTTCARYFSSEKTEKRYFPEVAAAVQAHGEVLDLLRGGQFHAALARHAAGGEGTRQRHFDAASELQLHYCKNCLRRHIRVVLQQRTEGKNDWKAIPKTEADFETGAQFYPSLVAA